MTHVFGGIVVFGKSLGFEVDINKAQNFRSSATTLRNICANVPFLASS